MVGFLLLAGCGHVSVDAPDARLDGQTLRTDAAQAEDAEPDQRSEDTGRDGTLDATGEADTAPVDLGADTSEDSGPDGGVMGALVNRGLLVRYFLEETNLDDPRVPVGLDMPLLQLDASNLGQVNPGTGRGLTFGTAGNDDGYCFAEPSPLTEVLRGSRTGTIEVVASIEDASRLGSRLLTTDVRDVRSFSMAVRRISPSSEVDPQIHFAINADAVIIGAWDAPVGPRRVFTFVLDTREADPQERARLYVDGTRVPENLALLEGVADTALAQNRIIDMDPTSRTCLGNRFSGQRGHAGFIGYGAYYESALTAEEVRTNAERLLLSDDR
ncbi:MAG: hypothetical protein AAF411_19820 [Myxococcota bacterium]